MVQDLLALCRLIGLRSLNTNSLWTPAVQLSFCHVQWPPQRAGLSSGFVLIRSLTSPVVSVKMRRVHAVITKPWGPGAKLSDRC